MKPTLNIIDYFTTFLKHLYNNKGSILIIIIYIIIFISVLKFREIRDKREEIINNWPEYKCRPYIIPIAGHFKGNNFFKYTFENFNECNSFIFKNFFNILIEPVRYTINIIKNIIYDLFKSVNKLREMAKVIRTLFSQLIGQVFEKLTVSVSTAQFYSEKLRNLIKKQYAIFQMIYFYLETLRMTFDGFLNGPMPIFLLFMMIFGLLTAFFIAICLLCPIPFVGIFACPICAFCFREDTLIKIDNDTEKEIKDINLNDIIFPNQKVLGKINLKFNLPVNLYNICNTWVSESHLCYVDNVAFRVSELNPTQRCKVSNIVSLVTETHKIYSHNNIFGDYCEIENHEIDILWNTKILIDLNPDLEIAINDNYSAYPTGFLLKPDENKNTMGYVEHLINENNVILYNYNDIICSGNNLVFENNRWVRVSDTNATKYIGNHNNILYHIIDIDGIIQFNNYRFRDFLETHNFEIYDWFHYKSKEILNKYK
jgi:hypothetical protein